ncbi:MAG: type IX secretion system sortase PorU [Candidatus Latescibacterota bacterium]|nr:MAG: type IX secretion system sortase PorU [Candidatus Latescibacterota bacterium]
MPRVGSPAANLRRRCRGFSLLVGIALALLLPSHVSAQAEWFEVLRDDDRGLELLLRAPEPVRSGKHVRVPGFAAGGEPGLPLRYERALLVAVPGPGGARFELLGSEERRLDVGEIERVQPLAARARRWEGLYPSTSVSLERRGKVRGRDVVTLRFAPLQYDADGGAHYTDAVRVRITFTDRAQLQPSAAPVDLLHATLVNATTASRWQRNLRKSEPRPFSLSTLPAQRLRVRIARTGVYELSYDQLRTAGVPVDDVDPTTFQIFFDRWHPVPLFADSTPASWQPDYELQETALWVDGESNHIFDFGERIVFYALGNGEYLEGVGIPGDSLAHAQHPYDRSNYGWLVWDMQPGARMQPVSVAVAGTPSDLVTRAWQRFHFEEDRQFESVDDLWLWQEVRETRPALVQFELDPGGQAAPSGNIRIGLSAGVFRNGTRLIDVLLNGERIGGIEFSQRFSYPPPEYFTLPATFQETNRLQLALADTLQSGPQTFFLKFDVSWERPLALPTRATEAGLLRWTRTPSTADETYELSGFGDTEPWLLDVTDPARAVRLVDPVQQGSGSGALWWARYGRGPGVRTHFAAVEQPSSLQSADLELRTVAALRQRLVAPDMLIVVHPSLRAEALRFAGHRAARYPGVDQLGHQPEVLVVDVHDVYENFSGGRVDPLAIRNYVKFLYGLVGSGESESRLRYLMLFGDATHDPRQLLPGTTATLVPTVQPWYADSRTRRRYAVDDWLAEMETPDQDVSFARVFPVPDLAIGRVTPRTANEARRIVDKLIAYDTSTEYGAWRTRLILAADDETTPSRDRESFHINNTERLVALTPPEWDIDKVYLTEFPRLLSQKPEARAALIRTWSSGCALINYQGHGAPRQLADEVLFLGSDIPSLTNGTRLPVFMAFSCTVSEFDEPQLQSMSEDMITSPAGGAVATMGATTPTFATPNARYNEQVWESMFAIGATSKTPFGIIHQQAKSSSTIFDGVNNETYVLLGDPAMTLLAPEYVVDLSSRTEPLEAGRSARVDGVVEDPEGTDAVGFNGFADVEVFGTADESGYTKADDPTFRIAYDLVGAPIYRGTVPVTNGRFAFNFFVPIDARLGAKARVSAYTREEAQGFDGKGAVGTVSVARAAQPDASTGPPRIVLRFPNNVTKVKPGTALMGEIRDENGVNIQGTSLLSRVVLDFEKIEGKPVAPTRLDVTSFFRYQDGSDSVGTISVPIPADLSPARYTATLRANDNLQEKGEGSIDFEVVSEAVELMTNVIAFPNPFKDRTYFFFELTDPSDVLLRVYTAAGREVWRHTDFVSEPQQVSVRWEGVDRTGDELANGTYIYRVEARPRRSAEVSPAGRQGPVLSRVGKVVIMRD